MHHILHALLYYGLACFVIGFAIGLVANVIHYRRKIRKIRRNGEN